MPKGDVAIALEQFAVTMKVIKKHFPNLTTDKTAEIAQEIFNAMEDCKK